MRLFYCIFIIHTLLYPQKWLYFNNLKWYSHLLKYEKKVDLPRQNLAKKRLLSIENV